MCAGCVLESVSVTHAESCLYLFVAAYFELTVAANVKPCYEYVSQSQGRYSVDQ